VGNFFADEWSLGGCKLCFFSFPLIVIEYRARDMHITIDEEIKSTLIFALFPPPFLFRRKFMHEFILGFLLYGMEYSTVPVVWD